MQPYRNMMIHIPMVRQIHKDKLTLFYMFKLGLPDVNYRLRTVTVDWSEKRPQTGNSHEITDISGVISNYMY